MQFTQEFNVDTFQFWSGAKDIIEDIKKAKKMDELQTLIEDYFADQTPTKTQVNDFVWFQRDFIFEQLEISSKNNS